MQREILLTILLLPLAGFLFNFFLYPLMVKGMQNTKVGLSGTIATLVIGVSFILSLVLFFSFSGKTESYYIFEWLNAGSASFHFGIELDSLNILLLLIITGIGSMIHLYSMGYMEHEKGPARFFSFLNLFCFMMLLLVLSDSLLFTFFGWEGVGLASFLLIGYWYQNNGYTYNARKAFIINRIADVFFIIGMFLLYYSFNSLDYASFREAVASAQTNTSWPLLSAGVLCLFVGAAGKSAQFPLHLWLPDAMVGPTPVSALIHAATMVTAGVFLCVKLHYLLDLAPNVMVIITFIGGITALMGALIATSQDDIKKVLAYSTVSQLGFMFLAVGVGAYIAAIFHLMSHAFFKALLFLGSGSVIHGDHGNQDIKLMGGLRHKMPMTFITFSIGLFALCGLPFFSGFFSKDEILYYVANNSQAGLTPFILGFIAAIATAIYSGRLYKLTFFGEYRGKNNVHESGKLMLIPLIVLAIFATFFGFFGFPHELSATLGLHIPHGLEKHFSDYFLSTHEFKHLISENMLSLLASIFSILGLMIGYKFLSRKDKNSKILENKFYLDEIANGGIMAPFEALQKVFDLKIENQFFKWQLSFPKVIVSRLGGFLRLPHLLGSVNAYGLFLLGTLVVFFIFFMGK